MILGASPIVYSIREYRHSGTRDGKNRKPSVTDRTSEYEDQVFDAFDNQHDRMVMGVLRAVADIVIVAAGTLRSVPKHLWTAEHAYVVEIEGDKLLVNVAFKKR